MKRFTLPGIVGFACLLPLMGCVVPAEPGPPVVVVPAPVVVGPPAIVVGPGYWGWRHGHRVWLRRGGGWRGAGWHGGGWRHRHR